MSDRKQSSNKIMQDNQNYKNHVRFFPLVHYFLLPVLLFNLIWQIVRLFMVPTWDRAEMIVVSIALLAMVLAARIQALRAQDRVIRLEERLRYDEVLPKDLAAKAQTLTKSQMIALRFASNDELGTLIERVLNGELSDGKEIKLAIKDWRADNDRV